MKSTCSRAMSGAKLFSSRVDVPTGVCPYAVKVVRDLAFVSRSQESHPDARQRVAHCRAQGGREDVA
eukprot:8073082-Pyramimonas_sp.AAC.1